MQLSKRTVGLVAAVAAGVTFAGLAFRPKPVPVETSLARMGELVTTIDNQARTRVLERYVISSPIAGRHLRISVHPGDRVETGEALVFFDATPLDPRQTAELQERLHSAEDLAREATAAQRRAQGLLKQAEIDRTRVERLFATGVASTNDVEQARTAAANCESDLRAARARASAISHEAEITRASLLAATPGHSQTIVLRSPTAGRVLNVYNESEGVVAAGAPILDVGDPSSLELVIDVLSRDAVKIAPGQKVLVAAWGGDRQLNAVVTRTEPSAFTKVSALGIEEQRVNVIALLRDPPASLGDRFEGQASVVLWNGNVLKVPSTALFRDGEQWAVFVIRSGRARIEHVRIGHRSDDEAEVTSGLAMGTAVIVHPSDQVRDGVRVIAQRAAT
jgi:HlyD family secretion protein